jgi:tetratricopeptide (TPR) repeat protein
MMPHSLETHLHSQIKDLCARGDALVEQRKFEDAFASYRDALDLVPEPAEEWEATTWILTAIGDLYFLARKFEKALRAFEDAVRCPGGLGNPFIHLRLGQCAYEAGDYDRSASELTRAHVGAGLEIFEDQDPKYLQFLRTRAKI